jgi:hypothetical protein
MPSAACHRGGAPLVPSGPAAWRNHGAGLVRRQPGRDSADAARRSTLAASAVGLPLADLRSRRLARPPGCAFRRIAGEPHDRDHSSARWPQGGRRGVVEEQTRPSSVWPRCDAAVQVAAARVMAVGDRNLSAPGRAAGRRAALLMVPGCADPSVARFFRSAFGDQWRSTQRAVDGEPRSVAPIRRGDGWSLPFGRVRSADAPYRVDEEHDTSTSR